MGTGGPSGAGTSRHADQRDAAVELVHEAEHLGQAQPRAGAVRLGGEEGVEGARRHLGAHADAVVDHRHRDEAARRGDLQALDLVGPEHHRPRAHDDAAAVLHRVARVLHEVHQRGPELRQVAPAREGIRRHLDPDLVRVRGEVLQERPHVPQHRRHRHRLHPQDLPAGIGEEVGRERRARGGRLPGAARQVVDGPGARRLLDRLQVPEHHGEEVVDVVRHPARHAAERLQRFRLPLPDAARHAAERFQRLGLAQPGFGAGAPLRLLAERRRGAGAGRGADPGHPGGEAEDEGREEGHHAVADRGGPRPGQLRIQVQAIGDEEREGIEPAGGVEHRGALARREVRDLAGPAGAIRRDGAAVLAGQGGDAGGPPGGILEGGRDGGRIDEDMDRAGEGARPFGTAREREGPGIRVPHPEGRSHEVRRPVRPGAAAAGAAFPPPCASASTAPPLPQIQAEASGPSRAVSACRRPRAPGPESAASSRPRVASSMAPRAKSCRARIWRATWASTATPPSVSSLACSRASA